MVFDLSLCSEFILDFCDFMQPHIRLVGVGCFPIPGELLRCSNTLEFPRLKAQGLQEGELKANRG